MSVSPPPPLPFPLPVLHSFIPVVFWGFSHHGAFGCVWCVFDRGPTSGGFEVKRSRPLHWMHRQKIQTCIYVAKNTHLHTGVVFVSEKAPGFSLKSD